MHPVVIIPPVPGGGELPKLDVYLQRFLEAAARIGPAGGMLQSACSLTLSEGKNTEVQQHGLSIHPVVSAFS